MGLNQEGKAAASVAALQKMMVVKAKVRRDGAAGRGRRWSELVPGDIVNIEAGDLVPADGRIVRVGDARDRRVGADRRERSRCPSRSTPVAADSALGDRVDMAFMNTQVTRGAGDAWSSPATGMATEVGHISGMLQARPRTRDAAHQAARTR